MVDSIDNLCNTVLTSWTVERQTRVVVHLFKKWNQWSVPTTVGSDSSASLGRSTPGCWRGELGCELNLGFKSSNVVFFLAVAHWISSRNMGVCPTSPHLWIWRRLITVSLKVSCKGCFGSIG